MSAAIGGTAAQLGGGKFANGAVTGAYSRMFNDGYNHGKKSTVKRGTTIGKEKLSGLDKTFRNKAEQVLDELNNKGYNLRIIHGRRTPEENQLLVDKDFASPNSKHLDGKALDFVERSIGYDNKHYHQYNQDIENAAKNAGLTWGGHFKARWDPNHIEMP